MQVRYQAALHSDVPIVADFAELTRGLGKFFAIILIDRASIKQVLLSPSGV